MSLRDIRRQIGQLVVIGFAGDTLPVELLALAREFELGGVILFARNVESPEQVAELAHDAQSLARELPLWVSVDQEGGRVARLRAPFTEWPPMLTLGRSGDEKLARRFATALATELSAVGISLDYAPVLDVNTNPSSPVIGDRALSDRAETVARFGTILVDTLQANGIAACGKHFPGHGDTSADSHEELPLAESSMDRLEAVELVPFRAAIAAGVASIMTAHVLCPALDEGAPVTLSRRAVEGLLRGELGYQGLVISDDLEMGAIAKHYSLERASVKAVEAGCDVLLLCGEAQDRQAAVLEALIHAVEAEQLPAKRVEDALARQRTCKERFLAGRERARLDLDAVRSLVGRPEHVAVAEEMAKYA